MSREQPGVSEKEERKVAEETDVLPREKRRKRTGAEGAEKNSGRRAEGAEKNALYFAGAQSDSSAKAC